jgi:YD repeat-containing protein
MADTYIARCDRCRWTVKQRSLAVTGAFARVHQLAYDPAHRVTIWDGPTSQVLRSMWEYSYTN